MVEPLGELVAAYNERDRAALEWKARGGKVVGCLGSDVPEEVLIAAGFLPVRICGMRGQDIEIASRYLEQGFDPLIRAQFSRIVSGAYRYLDHLIISNSSDAHIRVFYYLRAMEQLEPERPVPEVYFFDFLHTRFRMSALYNRERLRELVKVVEAWRAQVVSEPDLAGAIALCNENRALLGKVQALRTGEQPRLRGVQALQIIGASLFLPRQTHNRLLQEFLEGAQNLLPVEGVRLFVTGSTQDHTGFYELVESAGGLIVGEDHELGSRLFAGEVDPLVDPIDGIVDRYHLRSPASSQATISERVNALVLGVRASGAEGVIFFIHQSDDAPSWDFPEQRKALEALGIRVLLLDRQPYETEEEESLRQKLGEFIALIRANRQSTVPAHSKVNSLKEV